MLKELEIMNTIRFPMRTLSASYQAPVTDYIYQIISNHILTLNALVKILCYQETFGDIS